MSIKDFFEKNSFWGIVTLISFCGVILLFIVFTPLLLLLPGIFPEWLLSALEWILIILFVLFVFSSGLRVDEIKKAISKSREREEEELREKEAELLRKKQKCLERENELLEMEKVNLLSEELYRKLDEAFANNQVEECLKLRDMILENHSRFTKMKEEYDKKWQDEL